MTAKTKTKPKRVPIVESVEVLTDIPFKRATAKLEPGEEPWVIVYISDDADVYAVGPFSKETALQWAEEFNDEGPDDETAIAVKLSKARSH
jgi:hypothetical protein